MTGITVSSYLLSFYCLYGIVSVGIAFGRFSSRAPHATPPHHTHTSIAHRSLPEIAHIIAPITLFSHFTLKLNKQQSSFAYIAFSLFFTLTTLSLKNGNSIW